MDKAPDAFRTISEAAEDLDLPQHVLRFWETRFSQIKPLKRGGGRRYYRPEDIDLLKGIRYYLYAEGYTIKGLQRILKERGIRHVIEMGRTQDENYAPPVAIIPRADEEEKRRERALWPEAEAPARDNNLADEEFTADETVDQSQVQASDKSHIASSPPVTAPSFENVSHPGPDMCPASPPSSLMMEEPPMPRQASHPDNRRRLQLLLMELDECKRILDAVHG